MTLQTRQETIASICSVGLGLIESLAARPGAYLIESMRGAGLPAARRIAIGRHFELEAKVDLARRGLDPDGKGA